MTQHVMRVPNVRAVADFYCTHFGMTQQGASNRRGPTVLQSEAGYSLVLSEPSETVLDTRNTEAVTQEDGYWKIAFTTADVDQLRDRLVAAGVPVTEPRQFLDIGYLCHLSDPAGFTVELLQHRFMPPRSPAAAVAPPDPLLGLLTLRVRDPEASLAFYRDRLGMQLLSRQEVTPKRFSIYFLAGTDDRPPVADIGAVENREWLYQRPYTLLELQHRWGSEAAPAKYRMASDSEPGIGELTVVTNTVSTETVVEDPDGYRIRLRPANHESPDLSRSVLLLSRGAARQPG
ncbi:MAG: catechol 2,3-dioxygenase-like lactoylglutathione lyase family enzyme [Myxococcota bacterium]|jgi:catechol 2,3-dioxygenase-like lactoylglutathione lyase family enzyme